MKILWTANTFSPEVSKIINIKSKHSISWVDAMSERIKEKEDIHLSIACPYEGTTILEKEYDGITYIAVPIRDAMANWCDVIVKYQPDIIHAYGTEQQHNAYVLEHSKNIPVLISLQGLLSEYERHYYAGIDFSTMIRYTPLRDIIRPTGFFTGRKDFIKRSKNENSLLKRARYVEGRSTWDKVSAYNINPNLKYYYCPRMLRKQFYTDKPWNVSEIERYTILVTQGNYPIKGIHILFRAVAKLKEKYKDIKIKVTGTDVFARINNNKRYLSNGYERYLFDLAKKLDIINHIEFVGYKKASEMVELLKKIHLAVIPSAIENAPNSLAEAMIVGTPVIATFVGGNMDMLTHNENGFLYAFDEWNMLSYYIDQLFSSDELCNAFSKKARDNALKRHNPEELVENLYNIYCEVIQYNNENV